LGKRKNNNEEGGKKQFRDRKAKVSAVVAAAKSPINRKRGEGRKQAVS